MRNQPSYRSCRSGLQSGAALQALAFSLGLVAFPAAAVAQDRPADQQAANSQPLQSSDQSAVDRAAEDEGVSSPGRTNSSAESCKP